MEKWPNTRKLSEATLDEVNQMWSGLGYYSRGKRLWEGAKKVELDFEGRIPRTSKELQSNLPGKIWGFSFNENEVVLTCII